MSEDKDTIQTVDTGKSTIPPRYITHSDDSVDHATSTTASSVPPKYQLFGGDSEDDK